MDQIADELAEAAGISKKMAKGYAKFVFDAITQHLADGDTVTVGSFGKFDTAVYAARTGRNVRTGETLTVPPRHRIKFEMSRSLLQAFNDTGGAEDYDDAEL